jgi:hypothetical protein
MSRQYPERVLYALDVVRSAAPAPASTNAALCVRVRPFGVSPRYDRREFVYRQDRLTYQSDYYHALLIDPGEMLSEVTARWFRDAGLFGQVVLKSGRMPVTHAIEGSVFEWAGDLSDPGAPQAAMDVELSFYADDGARVLLLARKRYRKTVDMADRSPESLLKAWNRGLEEILSDFEGQVAASVAKGR